MQSKKTVLALLLTCLSMAVGADQPAAKPTDDIPSQEMNAIWKRGNAQPGNPQDRITHNAAILADARKLLADHPGMPPAAESRDILARVVMLPAAERLYAASPTAENREQLRQIATEVVKFPVYDSSVYGPSRKPVGAGKARAGYVLAKLGIYPTPETKQPQDAGKQIRAMLELFPVRPDLKGSADVQAAAVVLAARLASETKETELAEELCKTIAEKHLAAPEALDVLCQAGHPAVFETELTTLDGKKLSFPGDVKGKVVLLDFWATWCSPCKASLPHIKQLVEKYKDREVLIVGVSCDSPVKEETLEANRKKVIDFLAQNGYSWTQTYSGEWPKAAAKYGIAAIPTVFLIDKQGRIISSKARGQEERLIDQELAKPATQQPTGN
jgi:thiol-disulfide isomerase/thioredoxin